VISEDSSIMALESQRAMWITIKLINTTEIAEIAVRRLVGVTLH